MDDFDIEIPEAWTLSRKFRKEDLAVIALDLIACVVKSVGETLMMARDTAAMHANWRADRDTFHEEAALEIETLTNGDEN